MNIPRLRSSEKAAEVVANILQRPDEVATFYPYPDEVGGYLTLVCGPNYRNLEVTPAGLGIKVERLEGRALVVARIKSDWYKTAHPVGETAKALARELAERWAV